MPQTLRIRRSLTDLQNDYAAGNKKPLDDLMRAWKGIKALPPHDPRSFFVLGGYHGEPFRGAGWGSSAWWGGYCNHGNILFPTWHRVYLLELENALRTIPGCQDVTLPFWDETSAESKANGIPWALTVENFLLDGQTIPNPLRSFVFPLTIQDNINGDDPNYSKPAGYATVRYPLSGLVGTPADQAATNAHNAKYPDYDKNVFYLDQNVVNWLNTSIVVNGKTIPTHVAEAYQQCLFAPNYTVFSNTTSAAQWNTNPPSGMQLVVPLEEPHNDIHLAVGGYDVESGPNAADFSPIPGANGDMGENDTAGLDPIFFFHHAHVDRMFWLWQLRNGSTDSLEVIDGYPGTNSVDGQGPTPGIYGGSWLTLETPLSPFQKTEADGSVRPYTSLDCINIEGQLGYTYGAGSLGAIVEQEVAARSNARVVRVSGINRAAIRGSFVVSVYAEIDGMRQCIGREGILSRWSVQGCANCQTHLETRSHFSLEGLDDLNESDLAVEIRTRDGVLTAATEQALTPERAKKPFRVELVTPDADSPTSLEPVTG
jgi:tyrosinase